MTITDPRVPVNMHDPEMLEPIAKILREAWGIPAQTLDTGGGCFCIIVAGPDGYSSAINPDEDDGRRWWVSLDAPNGDYMGKFETEWMGPGNGQLPSRYIVGQNVAQIIRRLHPKLENTLPELDKTRIFDACYEADLAFWNKIVEHFPEVQFGDFGPSETMSWQLAVHNAVTTWLTWNHPRAQEFDWSSLSFEGF